MVKKSRIRLGIFIIISIFFIGVVSNNGFAKEKQTKKQTKLETWEQKYIEALDQPDADEEEKKNILKNAIAEALEDEGPPCECMRIAIRFEYKPYFVIRYIYEDKKKVKLDELCWCATSDGIDMQIIAKAALDAKKTDAEDAEPVFRQNEIAKSECVRNEDGLAYTAIINPPDPIPPPPVPPDPPVSPITP